MSNVRSFSKWFLTRVSVAAVMVSPALAKPPVVHDEMGKTLNVARKKDKLGIFILGTTTCSYCRVLRKHIDEGEVSITADSFVMADLDSTDTKVRDAFFKQFHLSREDPWKTPYVSSSLIPTAKCS